MKHRFAYPTVIVKDNDVATASSLLFRMQDKAGIWKKLREKSQYIAPGKKKRMKREENLKRCRRRESRKHAKRD
jgi:ribosomal protein S21